MTTLLAMFAKHWRPGVVKTRLAATLGAEQAAEIHRHFVAVLADRFGGLADERELVFAPADAKAAFAALVGSRWRLVPQQEGDLGTRMRRFIEGALTRARRVVLIGSDIPDLPAERVSEAFAALDTHDVVLGPASDGGYYLVGAALYVPPIFDGIAWGTDQVWPQTVSRLRAADVSWHELATWYDVDDERGLDLLLARLRSSGAGDPKLARLEKQLLSLLHPWGGP